MSGPKGLIPSYELLKTLADLGDSDAWFALEYCLTELSYEKVWFRKGKLFVGGASIRHSKAA